MDYICVYTIKNPVWLKWMYMGEV